MKYYFSIILIYTIINFSYSQHFVGSIYSGTGISDFENQSKAGYSVPVGLNCGYRFLKNFEVGLGMSTTLRTYKIEDNDKLYVLPTGSRVVASGTASFSQQIYCIYLKYNFRTLPLSPYLKVESGLYAGKGKLEGSYHYENSTSTQNGTLRFDLKNAVGYNFSTGFIPFHYYIHAVFFEAVYHVVDRAPDLKMSKKEGANSIEFRIGYSVILK